MSEMITHILEYIKEYIKKQAHQSQRTPLNLRIKNVLMGQDVRKYLTWPKHKKNKDEMPPYG